MPEAKGYVRKKYLRQKLLGRDIFIALRILTMMMLPW